jgi:hypothetical protein
MSYTKDLAYIDADEWSEGEKAIMLPHSCDAWVIGNSFEAKLLLADLQKLIPKLEEMGRQ